MGEMEWSIFKFPNNSKILFMKSMNNIATGLEQNHMNKEKKEMWGCLLTVVTLHPGVKGDTTLTLNLLHLGNLGLK